MPSAAPAARSASWRYDSRGWTRDLRIDFLRGLVFVLLFTSHFNFFSWMSLIGWERIGVVSSAEMFILLSGIVTGAVYGKKLRSDGLGVCTIKLFSRAWTLYKTAVIAAGLVALLRLVPWLDMTSLTTFTDPVSGTVYPLYPGLSEGFLSNLFHVLVLAASPHQFQIVGLYVVLFLLTPIIFWALDRRLTGWLLLASWVAYLVNYLVPETEPGTAEIQLTVAQFEYAFPVLAWQLLFVHGVVAGFHRQLLMDFFGTAAPGAVPDARSPIGAARCPQACRLIGRVGVVLDCAAAGHAVTGMPACRRLASTARKTDFQLHSFLRV